MLSMLTTNDFCTKIYGSKLYKLSFDAGFSCPNRDGKLGHNGCIFCSEGGSGDFAIKLTDDSGNLLTGTKLEDQIQLAKDRVAKKYKGDKYIAYFQAYTNTYADVAHLKNIYYPIIERDDIAILSIATRPDCLSDEVINMLKELNLIKPVWVELGLQTSKEESALFIRRGYTNDIYQKAVQRLKSICIHVITHVILYLPNESIDDMLSTIHYALDSGTNGIKLQLLHVLKNTDLATYYREHPFYIPTLEEYAHTVKACVDIIPDDIVIHRLTGDAPKKLLVEPQWSANKKLVINTVNELINPPEPYYVYMLLCGDGSYYTGSTNDVTKRFNKHASGKGCKYTASHQPVKLVYSEQLKSKSAALKREYALKQLTHKQKEALIISKH